MKVYVDELPKSCQKCHFCEYFEEDAHGKGKHEVACYFNGSLGNILYGNQTSPKTCPLETLADHDKKVRAEVVAEIKQKAVHSHFGYMGKTEKGYYDIYAGILEDIEQGGEE